MPEDRPLVCLWYSLKLFPTAISDCLCSIMDTLALCERSETRVNNVGMQHLPALLLVYCSTARTAPPECVVWQNHSFPAPRNKLSWEGWAVWYHNSWIHLVPIFEYGNHLCSLPHHTFYPWPPCNTEDMCRQRQPNLSIPQQYFQSRSAVLIIIKVWL